MLKEKIISLIKEQGAIPFDKFMSLALMDEKEGYYRVNNPIGIQADFTTSPEISQVFGELIGLWLLDVWLKLGSPSKCFLVELGAGRGTLMSDILRATKKVKQFHDSLKIEIIEINQELINIQKKELQEYKNISWKSAVEELQIDAPVLIYSNEFFDALPVKQYLIKEDDCFELMVNLDDKDELKLVFLKVEPYLLPKPMLSNVKEEVVIYETSPVANSIFHYLTKIVAENTGVILTIDYGYENSEFRNTIRGYKNHQWLSIFEIIKQVGEVDFTYNVNFQELGESVKELQVDKYEIITQREFLENLGIKGRVKVLLKNIVDNNEKENFDKRIQTLINPDEMGEKFKVFCISHKVSDIAIFKNLSN